MRPTKRRSLTGVSCTPHAQLCVHLPVSPRSPQNTGTTTAPMLDGKLLRSDLVGMPFTSSRTESESHVRPPSRPPRGCTRGCTRAKSERRAQKDGIRPGNNKPTRAVQDGSCAASSDGAQEPRAPGRGRSQNRERTRRILITGKTLLQSSWLLRTLRGGDTIRGCLTDSFAGEGSDSARATTEGARAGIETGTVTTEVSAGAAGCLSQGIPAAPNVRSVLP